MIKSTPHAHTTFVDGASTVEQMVLSAIEQGFSSIGFSEHAIQSFDKRYCLGPESEPAYIAEVQRVRREYRDRIAIYLGCERDRHSTADRSMYEYVIGSVHYMALGDEQISVDGEPDKVKRLIREGFDGDGQRHAGAYYRELADYVTAYSPDIIGHFDVIQKHNADGSLFDAADPRYEAAALHALNAMAHTGALLEINTGAMAKGYLCWPYPERRWLAHWRALGGRAILSSDCHDAAKLGHGFDAAIEIARAAGYRELWALNPKRDAGALFVPWAI